MTLHDCVKSEDRIVELEKKIKMMAFFIDLAAKEKEAPTSNWREGIEKGMQLLEEKP